MGAAATFIIADSLFNKGQGTAAVQSAVGGGPKKPEPVNPSAPKLDDQANENEAQKAAERRRRMYAGVGRSSTILTGPGGLGGLNTGNSTTPKMLLGL